MKEIYVEWVFRRPHVRTSNKYGRGCKNKKAIRKESKRFKWCEKLNNKEKYPEKEGAVGKIITKSLMNKIMKQERKKKKARIKGVKRVVYKGGKEPEKCYIVHPDTNISRNKREGFYK